MELSLNKLLPVIDNLPSFQELVIELQGDSSESRAKVLDAAKSFFIAALQQKLQRPVLVITGQPENSKKMYEQISVWVNNGQVKLFPEPDVLPYEEITLNDSAQLDQLQVLASLVDIKDDKAESTAQYPVIFTSALALIHKITPYRDFAAAIHDIEQGMNFELFKLLRRWQSMGYSMEGVVEVPGEMSHRGGIVDIFPSNSDLPVRLEFFGDSIESIRLFDPLDQRSLKKISSVRIAPVSEVIMSSENREMANSVLKSVDLSGLKEESKRQFEQEMNNLNDEAHPGKVKYWTPFFKKDSLLDYLPEDTLIVFDEQPTVKLVAEDLDVKAAELRDDKVDRGELPQGFPKPYFVWDELEPKLKKHRRLLLTDWGVTEGEYWHELNFTSAPSYAGQLPVFIDKVKEIRGQGKRLIITSHQSSRLAELLAEEGIMVSPVEEVTEVPSMGSLILIQGSLTKGWVLNDTCLFTDDEIFGFTKQQRVLKKRPVPRQRLFVDITPGDYVVHVEHGIAHLTGVTTMSSEGIEKEYLVLEYADGDKLYVPTDQIDRVSRYVGASGRTPLLSRLGTQEWVKAKKRVKESVAEIAEELLTLYAAREVVPGFAFSPDTIWQHEFEASFPYVETPDQITVQKQVKADMEKTKPMDRLVCGDVGYGKTEVAIRVAFKAVMDGKQVAILVPTTVLAEQHYSTFKQRLAAFPIRVEVLSRFRTAKEQQGIIDGLVNGSVDICIGTHRLIQKDVGFKDLGLLVIDEEQRFGVAHKEYLKKMRQEVDVLTLSATPIPRTLHMSMVGVRDMSVMETPPEERLPIKTYVSEYNERLVRDAIIRELERNGQVFFVHNRVRSIGYMADQLRTLVPEARIAIGHGQMKEDELETVMAGFITGETDVLVCTSIIESGLDMPNVNTMIVNLADKFGLTQLYQLRGRIGRGANLAYAYFLHEKGKLLTPIAEKRLRTIFEATELGAGFGIAMKDLEIRGAGSLLGVKQSGHISTVGFNLYCQLLGQMVEEQKARMKGVSEEEIKSSRLPEPSIDLPLPAYIPEDYIGDLTTRLGMYQKLVKLENIEEIDTLALEFNDRFGSMPAEVGNLLYAVRLKILATKAGIESISAERGQIVARLFDGLRFDGRRLEEFMIDGVVIGNTQLRLNLGKLGGQWQKVLEEILSSLK